MFETSKNKNLPKLNNSTTVLLVVAPYYRDITNQLVSGAVEVLKKAKIKFDTIDVSGALEIPTAITLASRQKFDGFIAIGCVIRGETSHYETVTKDSSRSLSMLGIKGLCIGNCILTVENYSQAVQRADPEKQNKGGNAAEALIHLLAIKEKFTK